MPSNLLAHHVKQLEQAGMVKRSRSEGDHRRTYLRLRPEALAHLAPEGEVYAPRVVFVCTHNSARSQLAAARKHGMSLRQARTAHVTEVLRPDDLVVGVCDNAHEQLEVDRDNGRRSPRGTLVTASSSMRRSLLHLSEGAVVVGNLPSRLGVGRMVGVRRTWR